MFYFLKHHDMCERSRVDANLAKVTRLGATVIVVNNKPIRITKLLIEKYPITHTNIHLLLTR